jgi:peroxiredoxin
MKWAMSLAVAMCAALPVPSTIQSTVQAVLEHPADREAAPSFQLQDSFGNRVALTDLRGKYVLLNFWATECTGCRSELPTFVALYQTYKQQGLAVVGVSMDVMYEDLKNTAEGWARVKPFIARNNLGYTILMDDGSVEKTYKVTAMPATYLIDKRGRIAARYIGVVDSSDLRANVDKLLAER